ncbi:aspartic peptidase domain-containing protein [Diplogelasinospora grovesii]|uniref:Aspartic peptidase domain-containing protein n=1 Tax=Diplogelasinospora grovesii TaxID=303347 RepID=A0AAN6N754_9PEZI|nr:aspartic peptidase domain-containing protein [Diplogelasinospora grovesii]
MKLGCGVSWVVAALLSFSGTVTAQNVVQFGLNRGLPGIKLGSLPPLARRATYTEPLANNITGGGYYAEVTVGTPGQTVTMVLDTGSSDAWVVSYKANLCTSARLQQQYGDSCGQTYNPASSSTYKLVERGGFRITYLDGGVAAGDYMADDFEIGGTTIKSLQMGYATQTVRGTGILGVGFSANEAADTKYPNIIDQFVSQGLISSKAYSLWLNDRRSDSGTILFGGIDTDKFIGPLEIIPILKPDSSAAYTSFEVELSGMSLAYSNGSTFNVSMPKSSSTLPAILDSGTTLSYLPDNIAEQIFSELGTYTDTQVTGLTFVDCAYLTSERDSVMTFNLGSAAIAVPVYEMVLDILGPYQSSLPSDIPFGNVCLFGIQTTAGFQSSGAVTSSNFALLGDTFLRSAYVVYDLTHHQIGIAQANLNSTSTSITELKADDSGLPSVTGVAAQQKASTTASSTSGSGSSGTSGSGSAPETVTVTASAKNAAAGVRPPRIAGDVKGLLAATGFFAVVGSALVIW